MATRPIIKAPNSYANSVGMVNYVLKHSAGYLAGTPLVGDTLESLKMTGGYIMSSQNRANEFCSALVNQIALVIVTSKSWNNPYGEFVKKGVLDLGETVEQVFVNLAKVEDFSTTGSVNDILADNFSQRIPDVKSNFLVRNFSKKYTVSVSHAALRKAFTTMDGLQNLVDYIVQSLWTGYNYDEMIMAQATLGVAALEGRITAQNISAITDEASAKAAVEVIKNISDEMLFLKTKFNTARVMTHTAKEDQYVLKSISVNNKISVQVLAAAFQLDEVTFAGHQVLWDEWDDAKLARLDELFGMEADQHVFSSDDVTALNSIKFVVCDRDFLCQYDNLVESAEQWVPSKLTNNYFLIHEATFGFNPFANACLVYVGNAASVTSVAVTPSAADAAVGTSLQCVATVTASAFANKDVTWSVVGADTGKGTYIDGNGLLHIGAEETATSGSGVLTVKATSKQDSSVYGTGAVTLVASAG